LQCHGFLRPSIIYSKKAHHTHKFLYCLINIATEIPFPFFYQQLLCPLSTTHGPDTL
jgi:hypothetical protein